MRGSYQYEMLFTIKSQVKASFTVQTTRTFLCKRRGLLKKHEAGCIKRTGKSQKGDTGNLKISIKRSSFSPHKRMGGHS